jgi:hypothetical protein
LAEVPVRHRARVNGNSKYGLERVFKVLCDLSVVWFLQRYGQKPMYLFGGCALVSFASSGLGVFWAFYLKLFEQKPFIETPLPLVTGTLFLVSVLCVLMGLLAELSIRIYHESQDKTTYLIDRTDNLTPRADAT